MYPQQELIRLEAYKAALRRDIARRRIQCTAAATQLAKPVEWLDRAVVFVRRYSRLAALVAVPLGFLLRRKVAPRMRLLGTLARWGPILFSAVRGIASAVGRNGAPRRGHER